MDLENGKSMDIHELKIKAREFLEERRWDKLFIEAYLTTQHLGPDLRIDLGITDVCYVKRDINIGYITKEVEFVVGEVKGFRFEIGGFLDFSQMADGGSATLGLSILLEDKIVFTGCYSVDSDDPLVVDDYSIYSVEEFHNDDLIHHFLKALHEGKIKNDERRKEILRVENERKYAGKFSF